MEAQAHAHASCGFDKTVARAHLFRHCGDGFDARAAAKRRARWGCADESPGADATDGDGDASEAATRPCDGVPDAWFDWPATDSYRSACPTAVAASDWGGSTRSFDLQSLDGASTPRACCEEEAGSEDGTAAWDPALDADFQCTKTELAAARAMWLPATSAHTFRELRCEAHAWKL